MRWTRLTWWFFSWGSVACQPLNPHWGKLKVATGPLASGDPQVTLSHMECSPEALALDLAGPLDALRTSVLLELLFASPVGRAQHPSQIKPGLLHNLLERLNGFTFSKSSRERQLPRVISQWRLLEDSLVPQSSDSWCNALGCSHTPKNTTSKQSEWKRGSGFLKNVKKAFQSAKRAHPRLGKEYI